MGYVVALEDAPPNMAPLDTVIERIPIPNLRPDDVDRMQKLSELDPTAVSPEERYIEVGCFVFGFIEA